MHRVGPRTIHTVCTIHTTYSPPWLLTAAHNTSLRLVMYNDAPAPGERTRRTFCAVCKHHYNARIAAQTAAVPVACAQSCTNSTSLGEKTPKCTASHHDWHIRQCPSYCRSRTRPAAWPVCCLPLSPDVHKHDEGHAVEDPTVGRKAGGTGEM